MATLEGHSVVVVGGTSGIGFGVAKGALLSLAAAVTVASSNQAKVENPIERLQAVVKENNLPGRVSGSVLDAGDMHAVEAFVNKVGEIDHLVWTSGDMVNMDTKTADLEKYKDMFNVRFWGPAIAAQKGKIRRSITLTVGQVLVRPVPSWGIRVGVPGAVDSMTRGLAVDLAPVRVNVISPGLVDTEFVHKLPKEAVEQLFAIKDKLLVKHIATPDEVAEAYLFAMKCTYITGQRIEVDGGFKYI